jgi:hypothetical protein
MDRAQRERCLDSFDFHRYQRDLDVSKIQLEKCRVQMRNTDKILKLIEDQLDRLRQNS